MSLSHTDTWERSANPPPSSASRPSHKSKKTKIKGPNQPASSSLSRSQLKRKIRDLTRLLNASTTTRLTTTDTATSIPPRRPSKLSATARAEHERALAAYKHELASQQLSSQRAAFEKRYHKVRFFERRKADRRLTQLQRELSLAHGAGNNEVQDELKKKILEVQLDLKYIFHFPPSEKYISLYRKGDDKATDEKRRAIREDIRRRMVDGSLGEMDVLDSSSSKEISNGNDDKAQKQSSRTSKKDGRHGEAYDEPEEMIRSEDESDGSDFFVR